MAITVGTDSYITVADATTYFANRLFTDPWTSATPEQQEQALKMACQVIERQILNGRKRDYTQTLQFPRCYTADPRAAWWQFKPSGMIPDWIEWLNGWYCETDVPPDVLNAQCEEALALLDYGNSPRVRLQQQNVSEVMLGTGMREMYRSGGYGRRRFISPVAQEIMDRYLAGGVAIQ